MAEKLLLSHEYRCINACYRFINRKKTNSKTWALHDGSGNISSLVIYSNKNILPLLCRKNNIPLLKFLNGKYSIYPVYSLQGSREDVAVIESMMEKNGFIPTEKINYNLMCIDRLPECFIGKGPSGLILRKPTLADLDDLAVLHAAYEQEEVLPADAEFNPFVSRLTTEKIFYNEKMLIAEISGRIIGKINTNAFAFTRFQVGGVYVHPDYRGLGIARRMTGEFIKELITLGNGISLFVKKSNSAAFRVYKSIGFEVKGDYSICYY